MTRSVSLRAVPALVALLVGLGAAGCAEQKFQRDLRRTATQGQYIVHTIEALAGDRTPGRAWPEFGMTTTNGKFSSSTDYFRQVVNLPPPRFGAPGLPRTLTPEHFSAANNAWCLVSHASRLPPTAPVLFTRNLKVNALGTLKGSVLENLSDDPPFGKKGFVFITRAGTAQVVSGEDLYQDLGRLMVVPRGATQRVLRP